MTCTEAKQIFAIRSEWLVQVKDLTRHLKPCPEICDTSSLTKTAANQKYVRKSPLSQVLVMSHTAKAHLSKIYIHLSYAILKPNVKKNLHKLCVVKMNKNKQDRGYSKHCYVKHESSKRCCSFFRPIFKLSYFSEGENKQVPVKMHCPFPIHNLPFRRNVKHCAFEGFVLM